MPPSNRPLLVERITGGVDTTSPTHLVVPPQWITGYNFRFSPNCEQVPRKALHTTLTGTTVLALATIPGALPGYGKTIAFLPDQLRTIGDSLIVDGLLTDTSYRRWSIVLYNGCLYYTNELNGVRCTSGSSDAALLNAPSGRYVATWYDHLVVGVPTYKGQRYADRVTWSHLYDFSKWEPDATNDADHWHGEARRNSLGLHAYSHRAIALRGDSGGRNAGFRRSDRDALWKHPPLGTRSTRQGAFFL